MTPFRQRVVDAHPLDVALDSLDQAERYHSDIPQARVLNLLARHQLEQYIEAFDET